MVKPKQNIRQTQQEILERKQKEYVEHLKHCLKLIIQRKNQLKEGIEGTNWEITISQSGQADYMDMQEDMNSAIERDNNRNKRKIDALILLKNYLNQ